MKCERAIVVVGGVGSRMLPWAYANEKCQLPLPQNVIDPRTGKPKRIARPVVDFVIEGCLKAGIRDITMVIGEGAVNTRRLYEGNVPVDEYFKSRGKAHLLDTVREVGNRATFRYIEQLYGGDAPYGTTVPVARARETIDQPGQTLIVMGDQFFYNADRASEAQNLLDVTERYGAHSGMLVSEVDPGKINHYGIALLKPGGFLQHMVEKPAVGSITEHHANASMYVVDQHILPHLDGNMNHLPDGVTEHMFTDVINGLAQERPVAVVPATGVYLDCGTPDSWDESYMFMRSQPAQ